MVGKTVAVKITEREVMLFSWQSIDRLTGMEWEKCAGVWSVRCFEFLVDPLEVLLSVLKGVE